MALNRLHYQFDYHMKIYNKKQQAIEQILLVCERVCSFNIHKSTTFTVSTCIKNTWIVNSRQRKSFITTDMSIIVHDQQNNIQHDQIIPYQITSNGFRFLYDGITHHIPNYHHFYVNSIFLLCLIQQMVSFFNQFKSVWIVLSQIRFTMLRFLNILNLFSKMHPTLSNWYTNYIIV